MKARGFTLIEVLIAIGVIGILSAVALPIYRGYVAKAEAASVTVAGLTSNFQSQLDAAEPSSVSASTGSTATSSNTATAGNTNTADNGTSSSNNPPASNTTTTASNPSTPSSETTSNPPAANTTPTPADSPPSSSVASSVSGGGGSSAGGSSTPTIGVPDDYKNCNPCEIIKSETTQIAFDLSSFGTIDSTKIKAQKKSDAITGNPTGRYDASSGQYLVTFTAHSKKNKSGSLTVSADSQSVTINLKTI